MAREETFAPTKNEKRKTRDASQELNSAELLSQFFSGTQFHFLEEAFFLLTRRRFISEMELIQNGETTVSYFQCDQIGRFFGPGQLFEAMGIINLPKSLTFLGNFCKGVKIFNFSSEIIFGQLLKTFGDFLLVTLVTSQTHGP